MRYYIIKRYYTNVGNFKRYYIIKRYYTNIANFKRYYIIMLYEAMPPKIYGIFVHSVKSNAIFVFSSYINGSKKKAFGYFNFFRHIRVCHTL